MTPVSRVQTLNKAVFIEKGINPFIIPPTIGK